MSQAEAPLAPALIEDGATPLRNPKHEMFCQEAVAANSLERGYELAGYSRPRGNAQRLSREPRISARLAYLWRRAADAAAIMGGRHLAKADVIANANILEFFDVDPDDGSRLKLNLNKVQHALGGAIQEISYDSNGRPRIKLHDSVGMLKFLIERADPRAPENPAGGNTFILNQGLLEMVNKFDGMTDLDIGRRIAFAMQLGQRAMKNVTPEPANGAAT